MFEVDGFVVIEWARGRIPGARLTIFTTQAQAAHAAREYQERADDKKWQHRYSIARVTSVQAAT